MIFSIFFYKLFNDIFKHISYLDIFRFLRTFPDPEESDSNPIRKFVMPEWSLILKSKNSNIQKTIHTRMGTWMPCLTDSVNI